MNPYESPQPDLLDDPDCMPLPVIITAVCGTGTIVVSLVTFLVLCYRIATGE